MAVVGIDLGTQSLKAVVVDDDLRRVGDRQRGLSASLSRARAGPSRTPALWLDALRPAIAAALARRRAHCRGHRSASASPASSTAAWRSIATTVRFRPVSSGWTAAPRPRSPGSVRPFIRARDRPGTRRHAHGGQDPLDGTRRSRAARRAARWHQPVSFVVAALCGPRGDGPCARLDHHALRT